MAKYLDLSGLGYFWDKIKAYITAGEFVSYGQQSVTDAKAAQARKNIAAGASNFNLVDNGWFSVREYGAGPFSGQGSIVNRWASVGVYTETTLLGLRGVRLSGGENNSAAAIQQILRYRGSELNNKTLTLSVLTSSGVLSSSGVFTTGDDGYKLTVTLADGWACSLGWYSSVSSLYPFIRISKSASTESATFDVYAIKLEIGGASTLAADVRPDYNTEADRCHDLDVVIGAPSGALYTMLCYCVSGASKAFKAMLPFDMNGTPSVSFTGSATLYSAEGSFPVSAITVDRIGKNAIQLGFTVTGTPTTGSVGNINFASGTMLALTVQL